MELLHLHGLGLLPLVRLAGLRFGLPIVVTAQLPGANRSAKLQLGSVVRCFKCFGPLLRRTVLPDRAIAISSELRGWFISDIRMSQSRVELIFNGVDDIYFRPPTESERRNARGLLGVEDKISSARWLVDTNWSKVTMCSAMLSRRCSAPLEACGYFWSVPGTIDSFAR